MFERVHHQRIQKVLEAMNPAFLEQTHCFFAGGTAIALLLGEYRESVDIDFLCACPEGYRELRNAISLNTLGALFSQPLTLAREVRADRYGIRTFIEVDGAPIKFEVVREDRIDLEAAPDTLFEVPVLSRRDLYAEKLLANTDRYLDKSQTSRDIIDLAVMIFHWGDIPESAWDKARAAYGASVHKAYEGAIALVRDRTHLRSCLTRMHMSEDEWLTRIPQAWALKPSAAPPSPSNPGPAAPC